MDSGVIEGHETADIGPFEADQAGDGFRRRQRCQGLNVLRGPAESGALQQVGRELEAPIRGADGGKIVLPSGGSGCARRV